MLLQVILVVVLSLLGRLGVEGRRRKELPIDRELPAGEAGFTQQRAKASECRFGGETYELEQTWHPDLGPQKATDRGESEMQEHQDRVSKADLSRASSAARPLLQGVPWTAR